MNFYRPPTTQGALDALNNIYRAMRAWRFYPQGHPTRRSSLSQAYLEMQQQMDGHNLMFNCGRAGFSFPDGEFLKDTSGQSATLAFELFVRRVQKITFDHDLFQEDLLELCKILSLSPEVIQQAGGFDTVMASRGIRSIWVNEFNLKAIRSRRQQVEQAGIVPQGIDASENGSDITPQIELQAALADALNHEQQLRAMLERLPVCCDDDIYLLLIRQVVALAAMTLTPQESDLLFNIIELLVNHADEDIRSESMRECARFAIDQISASDSTLQIVFDRAEQSNGLSRKALHAVIRAGGVKAITAAIELIGRTNSLKIRKKLSTILGGLGEAAVPALLDLMNDPRWFIKRNICSILGAIASSESLPTLVTCLHHSDLRVRKEAIRSLALLGVDGEDAILNILRSDDVALYPQAIASLGGMRSKKSLVELMKMVCSRDTFLKSLAVKIDALAAIALIGDRQVTPILVKLLEGRHLLAAARGRELKSAVAACLGRLGDHRALPVLAKLASGGGKLARACLDAKLLIEKTERAPDGIS